MNFLKIKNAKDMLNKTGKSVAECLAITEEEIKKLS